MTPRHELRRLIERQNLDSSDAHFRRFHRTLPREWRDAPDEGGSPNWLHWIVYGLAAWALFLYGG